MRIFFVRLFNSLLFASGIWGLALSFLFGIFAHDHMEGWNGLEHTSALFIYYLVNSILLVIASIFLAFRKIAGLVFFIIAVISILVSLFINAPLYPSSGGSLFFWTISIAVIPFWGSGIMFIVLVLINLIALPFWLNWLRFKD
ncbi:TPA: hypothetical protein DEB72_01075 [Patescibacteria group bacterium]|nr:MAG: hypothetical protein UX54_C0030G0006 [Parcubacteria group bacterium GW2011_GWA2_46_39]HBV33107.1 hypothetical protein [Patescibacteria group bacterium]